jgi:hypoxanthine phosphoribosyltransferase
MNIRLHDRHFALWMSAPTIRERVVTLASTLTADYQDKDTVLLGIMKGALPFMMDLGREINLPLTYSFFRVQSYNGTQSSGLVKSDFSPKHEWAGKHVLIVEDIVDTGLTMNFLMDTVWASGALSVKSVTLLFKPNAFTGNHPPDYVGFAIENEFVVGYGLDYNGLGRNLPDIYKIIAV